VPADRVRVVRRGAKVHPDRDFVLYWMIAARRSRSNFALDRAVGWASELGKPLVILEALRVGYPWASDRLHRFVLDGMRDNAEAFADKGVVYYPYVEPRADDDKGFLAALAARACVVVTDEFPCFFLPHMVAAAAERLDVCLEAIDGNGILPLEASDHAFTAAVHFRRHMQKELRHHLLATPRKDALARADLPALRRGALKEIQTRWPVAEPALLEGSASALARLPIDHEPFPVAMKGGPKAAHLALRRFVKRLPDYTVLRNEPSADGTSRLSPYRHFGHVSAHEVLGAVIQAEGWTPDDLAPKATAKREGFWGMGAGAEAFLEQVIVWRELSYNMCARRPEDYAKLTSLPDWAQDTIRKHAKDKRSHVYTHAQLEEAKTHDPLWNAAQRQLLSEGWFHNYMRMLWAKKILEWSPSAEAALEAMTSIMNRWSLDGRNPNSYAGYLFTFGRYDRPWPERPVFGKLRSMTSESTAKKHDVTGYLAKYSAVVRPR
jgi:deoxyribodipyrimidine photo-lyase